MYGTGAAPFMLGERGLQKLLCRKTKVASYNLDLNLVGDYWGWFDKRFYHHTGMVSNWCAHTIGPVVQFLYPTKFSVHSGMRFLITPLYTAFRMQCLELYIYDNVMVLHSIVPMTRYAAGTACVRRWLSCHPRASPHCGSAT